MKKIQRNLRGSFNVFSNSARQLEVPLILHVLFVMSENLLLMCLFIICTFIHLSEPFIDVI